MVKYSIVFWFGIWNILKTFSTSWCNSPDPVVRAESRNPSGCAKVRFSKWIQFHLDSDFYPALSPCCDKSPQNINYMRWATLGHHRLKRGHRDRVSSLVKRVFKKKNQHSEAFYFSQLKRLLWSTKEQKQWADWKYRWILLPAVPDWWKDQRTEGKSTWVHASIMPHIRPWHADGWSFCSSWHAAYALRERALMTRGRHKVQLSLRSIPRRPH